MSLICHGFISHMICLDDKNVVVWRTYADNDPSNIPINHPRNTTTQQSRSRASISQETNTDIVGKLRLT
jgi:hypothetical protein